MPFSVTFAPPMLEVPCHRRLALDFIMSSHLSPNGRAIRYAVIRRFAEYHAVFRPSRASRSIGALSLVPVPFHRHGF